MFQSPLRVFKTLITCGWLLCMLAIPVQAQEEQQTWRRVYTGEDSVIDLNVSSPTFEAGHILRASFRTVLSTPETIKEKPKTTYNSRLETIEFRLTDKRYRIRDLSLLDGTGQAVKNYANPSEDWGALKFGGMMQRLFDSLSQLPPFGEWMVIDYRSENQSPQHVEQLKKLLGVPVKLYPNRAEVRDKVCALPAYESRLFTEREFQHALGLSMSAVGVTTTRADVVTVKCETNGWQPPQSLLVRLPGGGMLMLWNGVFLVLDHPENLKDPGALKRRP